MQKVSAIKELERPAMTFHMLIILVLMCIEILEGEFICAMHQLVHLLSVLAYIYIYVCVCVVLMHILPVTDFSIDFTVEYA